VLAAVAVLMPRASATWSIIAIDQSTGQVAVASATCLDSFDLKKALPVVLVGVGGACAQSAIDTGALNRKKIWDALLAGIPASDIIDIVKQGDPFKCSRQYGIVDFNLDIGTFTGVCASQHKGKRAGVVGNLAYSIQGNILTGAPVLDFAEQTLLDTPGSLADRVMAAMEAAALFGGDGRCSCGQANPTGCGSPPVGGFDKSAHVGFFIVARMGDVDGNCSGAGCATGQYWLNLNVIGGEDDPDPVITLREDYERFLDIKQGNPDGIATHHSWSMPVVPGDGQTIAELKIAAVDVYGQPVTNGGAVLTIAHAEGSAGLSTRQMWVDHGDGTYTVRVQAGNTPGTDQFVITFNDDAGPATLFPYPTLSYTTID
jgi:hypothetical protein